MSVEGYIGQSGRLWWKPEERLYQETGCGGRDGVDVVLESCMIDTATTGQVRG